MEPPTLNLPLNLKPLFLLYPPLIPRPLSGPLIEILYPPANRYGPANRFYGPYKTSTTRYILYYTI